MPEGPEIRLEADRLHKALAGREASTVQFAHEHLLDRGAELEGRRVESVTSRGKAMLTAFEGDLVIYSHNQLYGVWRVVKAGTRPETTRQLRLVIENDKKAALLYSASDIELLERSELAGHPFLRRLGPDVLDTDVDVDTVLRRLEDDRFRRRSLGALLLDQGFVAGLGNYLRAEILFTSGVHPASRSQDLNSRERALLASEILRVTRQSYRTKGVTNDLERVERLKADGVPRRRFRFHVYKRDGRGCYRCESEIERFDQGGRAIFVCPLCQPEA
ncbi:MAG: endonuclease VIII [Acidobacteriota bacterium]